ncbi:MAG: FAD-dependent oxidoreductase [Aureliella sp.]
MSLGWELLRRGMTVQIVRHQSAAPPASWAGAGILPPAPTTTVDDPYQQLCKLSHEKHMQWASQLLSETGKDNGFRRCGGLYLAKSPAEAATLAANAFWWDEHGIEHQRLSTDEVTKVEPLLKQIADSIHSAWLLPDECQIRNPDHLSALESACRSRGAVIHDDVLIDQLLINSDTVTGGQAAGRKFYADQTCICSGAWSRLAMQPIGASSGIMPIRGQMILYKLPTAPFKHVINEGNRYMVAREDGHVLAGSVEEEVGYEIATTDEAISDIRHWAESIMPLLAGHDLKDSWAGLRPGSYDGFPYMGHIKQRQNLLVAAGHFRSGLHLSPGTAIVMADLIQGQTPSIDLTQFRPSRG